MLTIWDGSRAAPATPSTQRAYAHDARQRKTRPEATVIA
jgi:hypothetical protein